MAKKCLIEMYGVRVILKYDKTIVLEEVLSTLSKKCSLKTQLRGVTYYDLMIELVNWNKNEHFDRLGTKKDSNNIRIPIKEGRDVVILIEVAILDYKLRKSGKDYSKIFNKEIYKQINNKKRTQKNEIKNSIHGVLLKVNGIGTLIIGKSGVGKSEVGLELIAKGNKFIADDKVIIKGKYNDKKIRGYCTEIPYYMEVRGLGIVNIEKIYGVEYIKAYTNIDIIFEITEDSIESTTVNLLGHMFSIHKLEICAIKNLATEIEELVKMYRK